MNKVRVIGVGSPYGDDDIGWRVIDELKKTHAVATLLPEPVDLIAADRPGSKLITMMQGANFVIFVDAVVCEQQDGKILRLTKEQLITDQQTLSSHALDVANAIALAEKLKLLPEALLIIGICISSTRPIPLNQQDVQRIAQSIGQELKDYFTQSNLS